MNNLVTDDPETNALWVVRFTSIQFGICFFTSLTRTDANAALALLGLYSSFGNKANTFFLGALCSGCQSCQDIWCWTGRRKEATKLYFIFLLLSLITDFIWMIIYGNQISGESLVSFQETVHHISRRLRHGFGRR